MNVTVSIITTNEEQQDTKEARVEKIIKLTPNLVKDPVTKLFKNFKDVMVMKTDNLKHTKQLPHRITLKPRTTSVK